MEHDQDGYVGPAAGRRRRASRLAHCAGGAGCSDGKISFQEFKYLHHKYPQLLYPAFRLQTSIMARTLGTGWWEKKLHDLQRKRDKEREMAEEVRWFNRSPILPLTAPPAPSLSARRSKSSGGWPARAPSARWARSATTSARSNAPSLLRRPDST